MLRPARLIIVATAVLTAVGGCSSSPAPGSEPAASAPPAPLRVLSSNGVKAVIDVIRPRLEEAAGRPLDIEFSTAVALKGRIDGGERFDLAILTPGMIDDLTMRGTAAAGSAVLVARSGVGVGNRAGAPRPDVSTPAALKAALLAASSVAFTAEGQSRATVDKAYAALGIAEAMRAKSMLTGPGGGPVAVAEGKAEMVLTLVSEILPVPGVQLIGPLPEALQNYVSFTAARSAMAVDAAAADAVLAALAGPETARVLPDVGMSRGD